MRVLIVGEAGFIGSALTRRLRREPDVAIAVYDKLTYAADLRARRVGPKRSRHVREGRCVRPGCIRDVAE